MSAPGALLLQRTCPSFLAIGRNEGGGGRGTNGRCPKSNGYPNVLPFPDTQYTVSPSITGDGCGLPMSHASRLKMPSLPTRSSFHATDGVALRRVCRSIQVTSPRLFW